MNDYDRISFNFDQIIKKYERDNFYYIESESK